MNETYWIGNEGETFTIGQKGFLVEISNAVKGTCYIHMRNRPACDGVTGAPILDGHCGTHGDTSTYGLGMCVVQRIAKNGRAFVRELLGSELDAALEESGYPDLE
jgi:hypothetical protein